MSDWNIVKQNALTKKQQLDNDSTDQAIQRIVSEMNGFIKNYTDNAGISQNPTSNPDYVNANNLFKNIQVMEKSYIDLNSQLTRSIYTMAGSSDVENKLRSVGSIQQSIVKLEKELEDTDQDVDTSLTRQSTVEHPRQELSWYQGFGGRLGFRKPLHQTSIAFMIGFGLLLFFLSTLMLREFFIPADGFAPPSTDGGIFAVFTDSRFISTISGVLIVMVVLLVLTYKGYVGKNLR
jgi:hypothetical protein